MAEHAGDTVDDVIRDAAFAQSGENWINISCNGDCGRGPAVERSSAWRGLVDRFRCSGPLMCSRIASSSSSYRASQRSRIGGRIPPW